MTLFKTTALFTAAVASVVAFSSYNEAAATPARVAGNPHELIINQVRDAGYTPYRGSNKCQASNGLMGYINAEHRHFVICRDNVPFPALALATIRHEALHVAQRCKGGLLWPKYAHLNVERAIDEGFQPGTYPAHQLRLEAEARVMSQELDAYEVAAVVRDACR